MYSVSTCFKTRPYTGEAERSPGTGNQILAHCDADFVVLYQAVCPEIADFAVDNGYFGGPAYGNDSATVLKTSFLWTMKESAWGSVHSKERILAIYLERDDFERMLEMASSGTIYQTPPGKVISESAQLLWTPDYNHTGEQLERNTLLIDLREDLLKRFNEKLIDVIKDITDFVNEQHNHVLSGDLTSLIVPEETLFIPEKRDVCRRIMLDGFYLAPEKTVLEMIIALERVKKNHGCKDSTNIILFFQGSFNPVHCNHIQTMIECKKWLENNTRNSIVAGVMAVNSDEHLAKKFEDKADLKVKLDHRVHMCKLATVSHPWIHTFSLSYDNTNADRIRRDVQCQYNSIVQWCHVYGADRAIEVIKSCSVHMHNVALNNVAIIGRQGAMQNLKETMEAAVMKGKIGMENVYIIPTTLEDISSTRIRTKLKLMRNKLSKKKKIEMVNDLVETGWLDDTVVKYLVDNERHLYM